MPAWASMTPCSTSVRMCARCASARPARWARCCCQRLLAAGAPGKRFALPNSRIMIHQPLGGYSGQATDVLIHAEHLRRSKESLSLILARHTGRELAEIMRDTERDHFMTSQEALAYGLIDKVIVSRSELDASGEGKSDKEKHD